MFFITIFSHSIVLPYGRAGYNYRNNNYRNNNHHDNRSNSQLARTYADICDTGGESDATAEQEDAKIPSVQQSHINAPPVPTIDISKYYITGQVNGSAPKHHLNDTRPGTQFY